MAHLKIKTLFVVSLFLLSVCLIALSPLVSATTAQCTTAAQTGGYITWVDNTPPMPSSGFSGTFNFVIGHTIQFGAVAYNNYIFNGFYITNNQNGQVFAESFNDPTSFQIIASSFTWTITAYFTHLTYNTFTVASTSDFYSFISPLGANIVTQGGAIAFSYYATSGYQINSVLVDGVSVGITGYYDFTNVQANHAIYVSSVPIAQSDILVTFVNSTGGNIQWTDEGTTPLPPINPTQGNDGVYGFPVGTNLVIQAFPNTIAGYRFNNFTVTNGSDNGAITTNPISLAVESSFTITAYFDYTPTATYEVMVSNSNGGQLTWHDLTNGTTGGQGNYYFTIGQQVNFTAAPYSGYFFQGLYSTWGLLNGVTAIPYTTLVINRAFNITALFSDSSLNYSIAVSLYPLPFGVVNASTTEFQVIDGNAETLSFNVTSLFAIVNAGAFSVYSTNVYNTIPAVFDLSVAYGGTFNGLPIAALPIITPAHDPQGNYVKTITNRPFNFGIFSFTVQGAQQEYYEQYQGLEVVVNDSITGASFSSPMYILHWFSIYATPSPTPTPTPTATTTPNPIWDWLDIFWSPLAKLIYGCIALVGLMALFAYLLRKAKDPTSGILIGAVAALITNVLLFAWSPWSLFVVIVLILYLIVSILLKGT